jgi:hypothetical protein
MFSEMIADLKNGRLPDSQAIKKRLDFAITKKLGIIRQPYLLWPPDPKMNPPATHILWAALITADPSSIELATDILVQEQHEKMAAKKGSDKLDRLDLIQSAIGELMNLLPENSLQTYFQEKIEKYLG